MNSAAQSIQTCTSVGTNFRYGSRPTAASPFASKKRAKTRSVAGVATTGHAAAMSSRWSVAVVVNAAASVCCNFRPIATITSLTRSSLLGK